MLIWLAAAFVGLAYGSPHREPCKIQCDGNFGINSIDQPSTLLSVCRRGCDLYTVALISTTHVPNHPIDISSQNLKLHSKTKLRNGIDEENSLNSKIKDETSKESSSKTTVEPSSQPVQDHPEEASKQTTTTNGPSRVANKKKMIYLKLAANQNKFENSINYSPFQDFPKQEEHMSGTVERPSVDHTYQPISNDHSDFKRRLEEAKHSCRHACAIAYITKDEQKACVFGCHFQQATSQKSKAYAPKHFSMFQKSSLATAQQTIFNMAGHIGSFIRVSWSWAFPGSNQAESNNIQVYGTDFSGRRTQMPFFANIRSTYSLGPLSKSMNIKPQLIHVLKSLKRDFILKPEVISDTHDEDNTVTVPENDEHHRFDPLSGNPSDHHHRKPKPKDWNTIFNKIRKEEKQTSQQQLDILECISRKSGLPRWFIAITIFSSIPIALWLCFSLTAPPEDVKVVKTKLPENDFATDEFDEDDYIDEKMNLIKQDDIKIRIEKV